VKLDGLWPGSKQDTERDAQRYSLRPKENGSGANAFGLAEFYTCLDDGTRVPVASSVEARIVGSCIHRVSLHSELSEVLNHVM
jgi:hypothetical protein